MDIEMQLKKRIAMISGATGGLGNIATKIFAEYGVKLALISRDNEKLRKLSNTLDLPDENVLLQNVDISEPESALKAVDSTLDYFSQIDIYLHLVGGWVGGNPVTEVMQDDIESMLKQHLWSTFFLTK
ncbi:MAG: SDR family oxidoreductase, partial [Anaerolineales bacterium]